ncbi:ORF6N domain-containing protein [Pedobacter arcticus]|uniref:ORF6N domain-containing protein n=1 Tax=Pedobacter arcticus TaxID=752140 RepID=UPI00037E41DA|nr:ORF6N domain-containing protein [Pedobacter arcticus]
MTIKDTFWNISHSDYLKLNYKFEVTICDLKFKSISIYLTNNLKLMPAQQILSIISDDIVINKIYEIRGLKAMLDSDLAELYGVETRVLNQAVQRNGDRFPKDFMFQLIDEEWSILKSQFVTSSWGGRRKLPNVFTEHGVSF